MKDLFEALAGSFTTASLGCIGDEDFRLPDKFLRTLTVVEVDAEGGAVTKAKYHRKICIDQPIAGQSGNFVFYRNSFAGTCSLLKPRSGLAEVHGFERYCQIVDQREVECETLPTLLARNGVAGLDYLKTDVEGLDFAIVKSCQEYLGKTLLIQCELRFEPFYETEPYFHEAVLLLAQHGYEVLDLLHVDRWKYKTPHWNWQVEGRAVWADFLFVLRPDKLKENFGSDLPLAVAKQVILACMLNKKNYGEYLLERFKDSLPSKWVEELRPLVKPRPPGLRQWPGILRKLFMPIELFLKHRINRSCAVSIRSG